MTPNPRIWLAAAALAAWSAAGAQEQCPTLPPTGATCFSDRVCITWTAPTGNTDGTLLRQDQRPLTYRIWRRDAGTWRPLAYTTSATTITLAGEPRGLQCYAVEVIDARGSTSELSCFACKTVRFPGPSDGRLERPTDGSIEGR